MTAHSVISPSSAHRWLRCPGSVALCADMPETSSAYAEEGTKAHDLAARLLVAEQDSARLASEAGDEMLGYVLRYTQAVDAAAQGGVLYVEQRVDLSDALGTPETFGTADAVVLHDTELQVHDLKYGRGVRVDAEENEQLMLYALGALKEYELLGAFERVRLFIHQPRLEHVSEWTITIDDLKAWGVATQSKAALALSTLEPLANLPLAAGEKQCRFCSAKATCPALAEKVHAEVVAEFDYLAPPAGVEESIKAVSSHGDDRLAGHMQAVDLVEMWCKAVREEAFRRLAAGEEVPGYKLVEGRRGARAWTSDEDAETTLKSMRLKVEEMYDLKLISPTSAEKLSKAGTIGPRQWPKLQSLIAQPPGKPSVAPENDKRPAISLAAAPTDFEDLTA